MRCHASVGGRTPRTSPDGTIRYAHPDTARHQSPVTVTGGYATVSGVLPHHGVVDLGLAEDEFENRARRVGAQLGEVDHEDLPRDGTW